MSREYFTRTSLYLVRLKIFEWIKLLRRHLRQIQGNWGGTSFITALRVNSRLIIYACKNAEMNLKFTSTNGFNFWIINSLMESWGVRSTWFDCKRVRTKRGPGIHGSPLWAGSMDTVFKQWEMNKNRNSANIGLKKNNNKQLLDWSVIISKTGSMDTFFYYRKALDYAHGHFFNNKKWTKTEIVQK